MTTETVVRSSDGRWTEYGYQLDGLGQPIYTSNSGLSVYERSRQVTVSSNSPRLWRKVIEYVSYRPRSGRIPNRPREPHYARPLKPRLRPRRPSQGDASWSKTLTLYKQKLVKWEAFSVKGEASYRIRLAKYKVRLAKYDAYLAKVKNGVPKKVRKRVVSVQLDWHAYSRTVTFDTGTLGVFESSGYRIIERKPVSYVSGTRGDITNQVDTVKNGSWPTAQLLALQSNALTAADSIALNRFHEKLSGEQVHLGNLIAERAQTVGMLADAVKRLSGFLTNFTPKKAARALLGLGSRKGGRKVANDYLAFKFGAEPLMDDVKGAAEAVAHFESDNLRPPCVKVTGSANKSSTHEFTFLSGGVLHHVSMRVDVNVRYVCEYTVDNFVTREMSKLGLVNPAEILWELTPWSFVVDWVFPVGNYLRHLTNEVGLTFSRGTKSTRIITTTTVKVNNQTVAVNSDPVYGSETRQRQQWSRVRGAHEKTRVLLTNSPYVQTPQLKSPFSFTHVLEGLALLYQKKIALK